MIKLDFLHFKLVFLLILFANVLSLMDKTPLTIKLKNGPSNIYLKGTLDFTTDMEDKQNIFDEQNIIEKTQFKTYIQSNNKNYEVSCFLWKAYNIKVFCQMSESLPIGKNNIIFSNKTFEYENYAISVNSSTAFEVNQNDMNVPFLFANKQYITVSKDIETYELRFKFTSYNNEQLALESEKSYFTLDDCSTHNKELICKLSKSFIEEIMTPEDQKDGYDIYIIIPKLYYMKRDYFINDIKINIDYLIKEDIYVGIENLLDNVVNGILAYETNISAISNVYTYPFTLDFGQPEPEGRTCIFRKSNGDNKLILFCIFSQRNTGEFSFGEINEKIVLDRVSSKYRFILDHPKNEQKFNYEKPDIYFSYYYSRVLDFTKAESITILFSVDQADAFENVKLNPESSNLECNTKDSYVKCIVPKSHFQGKQDGYYYIHYKNSRGGDSIAYSSPAIQVITSSPDKSNSSYSNKVILSYLSLMMTLLV